MSSLRDRISRLRGAGGAGPASGKAEPAHGAEGAAAAGDSAARLSHVPAQHSGDGGDSALALPSHSRTLHTEYGSFVVRERKYSLDHAHGLYRLGELEHCFGRLTRVSRKYAGLREIESHRKLLFLDTETTGLGIGAGNVPFMIGIGFYTDSAFVVQQLFVRDPGEELAMLGYFAELCADYTHVVTYNGRTFDWPVIANRCVMNRIALDGAELDHLDLLYISRNLWKHSLESCRLSKVEEERLGIVRVDDVSGALAPMIYFQFLADGDIEPLEGVFEHNELDVLTLATLASHLGSILNGTVEWPKLASEDLFRIGVWLAQSDFPELAERPFESLLGRSPEVVARYASRLAAVYKKQRRYDKAVPLWKIAAGSAAERRADCNEGVRRSSGLKPVTLRLIEPLVELAMYHEHHSKQYDQALHWTEEAMTLLEKRLALHRQSERERELLKSLKHRRTRLLGKAGTGRNVEEDGELRLF